MEKNPIKKKARLFLDSVTFGENYLKGGTQKPSNLERFWGLTKNFFFPLVKKFLQKILVERGTRFYINLIGIFLLGNMLYLQKLFFKIRLGHQQNWEGLFPWCKETNPYPQKPLTLKIQGLFFFNKKTQSQICFVWAETISFLNPGFLKKN